jgi:hypothetical protein
VGFLAAISLSCHNVHGGLLLVNSGTLSFRRDALYFDDVGVRADMRASSSLHRKRHRLVGHRADRSIPRFVVSYDLRGVFCAGRGTSAWPAHYLDCLRWLGPSRSPSTLWIACIHCAGTLGKNGKWGREVTARASTIALDAINQEILRRIAACISNAQ